ncbi:hypothetical protein [Rhizobium hainanense]|uniref:Uncharacterized protein n=1 Tax=Rhizobium hainanense TaxID=52131 RepID=A0A1C3WJ23_9HYPH|nr:hypothetical protein [Rhizobium hainanense]SCB39940.1 hypothetical protein GA0061100_12128 [Rhizobium hainanense]
MKRVTRNSGDIFNIRLRSDLFTLAQATTTTELCFFNIFSHDGKWKDVDLNRIPELFCAFTSSNFLKYRAIGKIKAGVIPSQRVGGDEYRLSVLDNPDYVPGGTQFVWRGANLVKVDPIHGTRGTLQDPVIKSNLGPEDREIIEAHEFTNMRVDPELTERLILCYEAGYNIDPFKARIFPNCTFLTNQFVLKSFQFNNGLYKIDMEFSKEYIDAIRNSPSPERAAGLKVLPMDVY